MTDALHRTAAATRGLARRVGLVVPAILVLLAAAAGCLGWITRDQGRVFGSVRCAGVRVGGMTLPAARAALRARASELAREPIILRTGDRDWTFAPRALGISYDADAAARRAYALGRRGWFGERLARRLALMGHGEAPVVLPARLNEAKARAALEAVAYKLSRGPRDASARLVDGAVEIVPEVPGGTLDVPTSLATLRGWAEGDRRGPVVLAARTTSPRIRAGDLRPVKGLVAEFSTSLHGSSRNRVHNVTLAAEAVDGHVLLPGEIFSYDKVVGPRTEQAGYRTAPILRHGELVPGTGGGACQVSSTLYNVALLTGMKVLRRSHHSRPVHYVKPGLDATVVYGALDLKFQNTTESPVVLRAWVAKRRLWMQALGHVPAPQVEIVRSPRWSGAAETVEEPDPALPAGERAVERKPQRGLRVLVERIVGEGAGAKREVVSDDYYRPVPGLVRVGPAFPSGGDAAAAQPASPVESDAPSPADPSKKSSEMPD